MTREAALSEQAHPVPDDRNWEISTYEEGDKAGVLALVRNEYGDVDLAQESYFDWLRAASPPGVRQWLVREKGSRRVISSGSTVGARAIWRGQEVLALLGFNIIVAPEYRRQGIHTTLTKQTGEDVKNAGYCFTTVFPNPKSKPQLDRSKNFHHVSQVPLVIRPLDMRALADAAIPNRALGWAADLGWQVAGRTLWRSQSPPANGRTTSVAEDTVLDEGYDRFWDQVKTKYDLMLVRDQAFLQWRFHDIPTREYQVLSARQHNTDPDLSASDSTLLGYIVLRQAEVRGIMTGMIADFLVLPGQRGDEAGLLLLQEALQRFEKARVPLAGGLVLSHTQEYAIMRRAGFLSAPQQFAPQSFHLFIRSYCDEPPLSVLTRPESWSVSIADHDAV